MQVVLIKGESGYGALGLFIGALAEAFWRRGFKPAVVDAATEPDLGEALRRTAAEGPVALAYSFGFGEFRSADGRSVGELLGAPHVVHYVDYPLSHALRLDRTPPQTAILTVDPCHVEAIAATYGADHFAFTGFCPHGALGEAVEIAGRADAWTASRPIPILFCATLYRPGEPTWRRFPLHLSRLFDAAFEIALAEDELPALDALRRALAAEGLDPETPDLRDVRRAATFIHEQVGEHRRLALVEAAARAGAPLVAFGRGWEPALARFDNIAWGGEARPPDALRLMASARVVLNVNANFCAGSHERPISALLAGAAAVSDHSRFWAEQFRAGEEMLLYRWTALDEGVEQIMRLADDPERARAMAEAGQARVRSAHLWAHRADTILAAAEAVRKRLSPEAGTASRAR